MQVIEGFHINKVLYGTKKGQEYVNYSKRYIWRVPDRLEGEVDKGDIVWTHVKKNDRDIEAKVLVVNIFEQEERPLRSIISIDKKYKSSK